MAGDALADRWPRRPAAAAALRAVVVVVPGVVAISITWLLATALPRPSSVLGLVVAWALLAAIAVALVAVVERAARRLLPLSYLLDLSLLFPGPAPTRFRMALRAGGVNRLHQRIRDARTAGERPDAAAVTILTLAASLAAHDRRTRGHSERVRAYTELLGDELGVSGDDLDRLRWAALLHDIGKLVVPPSTLNKGGEPDPIEWRTIRRHPEEGSRIAGGLLPWLGEWGAAIAQHHEHFDGSGYPRGLAGEDIALAARIVAVADAFETMTGPRSYRSPVDIASARAELTRCAGTHFDPVVVRAFLNLSTAKLRRVTGALAGLSGLPLLRNLDVLGRPVLGNLTPASAVVVGGVAAAAVWLPPPAAQPASPSEVRATPVEEPAGALEQPADPLPQPADPAPLQGELETGRDHPAAADTAAAPVVTDAATRGRPASAGAPFSSASDATEEPIAPGQDVSDVVQPAEEAASGEDHTETAVRAGPPQPFPGRGSTNEPKADPPEHAEADPDPDTSPGSGADPQPRVP